LFSAPPPSSPNPAYPTASINIKTTTTRAIALSNQIAFNQLSGYHRLVLEGTKNWSFNFFLTLSMMSKEWADKYNNNNNNKHPRVGDYFL